MKRSAALFALLALLCVAAPPRRQTAAQDNGESLVYADFENVQDKKPRSNRGGTVQLTSYQESTASKFKGLEGSQPPAPEIVRLKQEDPNHSIAFDYELYSPNQYAGVGVEVQGQPY